MAEFPFPFLGDAVGPKKPNFHLFVVFDSPPATSPTEVEALFPDHTFHARVQGATLRLFVPDDFFWHIVDHSSDTAAPSERALAYTEYGALISTEQQAHALFNLRLRAALRALHARAPIALVVRSHTSKSLVFSAWHRWSVDQWEKPRTLLKGLAGKRVSKSDELSPAEIVAPMLSHLLTKATLKAMSERERAELTGDVVACFDSVPGFEGPDRDLFRVAVKLAHKSEIDLLQMVPETFRERIRKEVEEEEEYERTGSAILPSDPLKLRPETRRWLLGITR